MVQAISRCVITEQRNKTYKRTDKLVVDCLDRIQTCPKHWRGIHQPDFEEQMAWGNRERRGDHSVQTIARFPGTFAIVAARIHAWLGHQIGGTVD